VENDLAIPIVPNVSLIAFYGDKPNSLIALIEKIQAYLSNLEIARGFVPYKIEQVHATIIGCEGLKTASGVINKWFYDRRQEIRYINFSNLVDRFKSQIDLPLTIRFGGYDRSCNYNFLSRQQHLYFRSFQIQSTATEAIPILIGWSWDNGVSLAIDNLRYDLQQFGLLHKYHAAPEDIDNDFYLRLGTIDRRLTVEEAEAIATKIRDLLEIQPLYIPIELKDLAFARYQDLFLTRATTKVIPVADISAYQLEQLYSS
jgi:hypothetical protein